MNKITLKILCFINKIKNPFLWALEGRKCKSKMDDFKNFMRWLWNNDRETYTLIMLGHTELITKELMDRYNAESEE